MSDSSDNPKTRVNDASFILPIMAMVLLLSTIPPAIFLVCVRFAHPEYLRRNVPPREGTLPTNEQPIDSGTHRRPLLLRVRAAVLKLRGVAVAAGVAVTLRSREVFDKVRGRMSGPSGGCGHRYSDLPIMRNKSWQMLAESHTELTLTGSKDDKVDHETVEIVENPMKATKAVHFDLGEDNKEPCIRKPEQAVLAEVKA